MKARRTGSIRRFSFVLLIIALVSSAALAQSSGDSCHVYFVDVSAAEKAYKSLPSNATQEAQAKALSSVMKILGEFQTVVGEEELTTKSYPFPDSKLMITASVFYTDESMPADSMMLGLVVSDKALKDALSAPNNAVAEINYNENMKIVRVRKYLEVSGHNYLVGLQCNHQATSAK
jgi:hypothetical protein